MKNPGCFLKDWKQSRMRGFSLLSSSERRAAEWKGLYD